MCFPKILTANLTTNFGKCIIQVRGVEDIASFLKTRRAYLNWTAIKNWTKANVVEILARVFFISLQDEVSLAVDERNIKLRLLIWLLHLIRSCFSFFSICC